MGEPLSCAGPCGARCWSPRKATTDDQQRLGFIEADRKAGKRITGYEYVVLVTNTDYEILSLGQLYHDRADAEHAGQTTITLIGLHAHFGKAKQALMRVSACLKG